MESLWILIPLSAVLVLGIIAVFGWAVHKGQFEDLEREGERILDGDTAIVDAHQVGPQGRPEQSATTGNPGQ